MERLEGRVAVVTGGAGGIGLALGRAFGHAGMSVVLADVGPEKLEAATAELEAAGMEALGVVCDVGDLASVQALHDATVKAFGAVHVLCNNAGIGAGAEGPLWEHEERDWEWAISVNVWGVIHGISTFVPTLLAQGDEGHVVNTSSGNGGLAPLPSTPQYAVTKAAVVTLTECLYAQLRATTDLVGASVLFPGPNILRTGLFESWRTRPERFAKTRPRKTPYVTVEQLEEQMRAAGVDPQYTEPAEVAGRVVDALRTGAFWILPESENSDATIRARADSMLARTNPTYLDAVPGARGASATKGASR
ncbi:MAG: SDR family NAD(P)-dependent oxidoreductase [Acidimicrobiales bacterium]|nr:SDR family NAD(P)-dependent oxidoreductase [Acidimicrobiales bacterium]